MNKPKRKPDSFLETALILIARIAELALVLVVILIAIAAVSILR